MPPPRALHILHVSEAFGGGISSAVIDYARRTPEFDHTLLVTRRRGEDIAESVPGLERLELRPGLRRSVADIRDACRRFRIDVVHAHSSYAGVYARLAVSGPDAPAVVYSPHCFAFERTDLSARSRFAFRAVERVLAGRTTAVVTVGRHERSLAERTIPGRPALTVPHLPSEVGTSTPPRPDGPLTVGTVGRLCAQKDPGFLCELIRAMRRDHPGAQVRWLWIGDGEPDRRREVESLGVEVTGWMPREEAVAALAGVDAYLHTGAWEGFPVAVVEAAAAGVTVVARRIDALVGEGVPNTFSDVDGLAAAIADMVDHGTDEYAARTRGWYRSYVEQSEAVDLAAFYQAAAELRRSERRESFLPLASPIDLTDRPPVTFTPPDGLALPPKR
jgi:glycosyltransferase involved in cell wall biosynthesis